MPVANHARIAANGLTRFRISNEPESVRCRATSQERPGAASRRSRSTRPSSPDTTPSASSSSEQSQLTASGVVVLRRIFLKNLIFLRPLFSVAATHAIGASVCRQPEPSLRARFHHRHRLAHLADAYGRGASIASGVSPTAHRAPVNDRCTKYGCLADGPTGRIARRPPQSVTVVSGSSRTHPGPVDGLPREGFETASSFLRCFSWAAPHRAERVQRLIVCCSWGYRAYFVVHHVIVWVASCCAFSTVVVRAASTSRHRVVRPSRNSFWNELTLMPTIAIAWCPARPDGVHSPSPPPTRPVHPSAGSRSPASARHVNHRHRIARRLSAISQRRDARSKGFFGCGNRRARLRDGRVA